MRNEITIGNLPKRKISRAPQPKGTILDFDPRVPKFRALHPSVRKSLRQWNKYYGDGK